MDRRGTAPSGNWKWVLVTAASGGAIVALAALLSRRASAATLPTARPFPRPEPPLPLPPSPPGRTPETVPTAISRDGARFIAQFEGFGPALHNDPVGHCTIGIGHLVHRGPCNGSEPAEFKRGLTEAQALALLAEDLRDSAATVTRLVRVPLTQQQFDALISFVFNVGQGNFSSSTLLQLLNQGDFASVPAQLNRFVFASGQKLSGLVRRRAAEGQLFSTGDYGNLTIPIETVR